jgi:hypothetical protein
MSVVGYLRDVSEPENYFEVFAGRVTVGRAESNDIKISSRSVSSHHAEIEIEPSARPPKMVVTDLGSRNATFVNEVRLLGSSRAVAWGDVVRFGYDTVTYRLVQELEGPKGLMPSCFLLLPTHIIALHAYSRTDFVKMQILRGARRRRSLHMSGRPQACPLWQTVT